jgi:Predicted nuclease of the RecB family
MVKHHSVVLEKPDGGVELYPMKQWLRDNPQYLPEGMHPDTDSSHTLRAALRNQGWTLEVRSDQVLVIKPNDKGDTSFATEVLPDSSEDEELIEAEEITFGLERDLQSALRANIDQLEPGLKITDDGRERVTEAGRIDITATDSKGTIVVIELKAGTAAPEVVAQVLAYMGTLAEVDNKPVRGILVAGDFHKRVVLASRAISNLELKKYSFQFKFDTVK